MKVKEFFKRLDYRHYICLVITLGFVACTVFLFPSAFGRVVEGGRDLGLSVAYYFCELFRIPYTFTPTVNELPTFSMPSWSPLPPTWEEFQAAWGEYWRLWASKENFLGYLSLLGKIVRQGSLALIVLLPFVFLGVLLVRLLYKTPNNRYDRDSLPLRIWKIVMRYTFVPVKAWCASFLAFLRRTKYPAVWLAIWVFNFNGFAVVLEAFAYYFYFVFSFDFVNLYRQVYKLFLDLVPMLLFVPPWAVAVIALFLFDKIRKRIAERRLSHFERKNRGFINARPIVTMIVGTMGTGKTTMLTDMCLSAEVMFRDKAFELLLENDLKFPNFPWISFENELRAAIAYHTVYNLATCRAFVRKKRKRFEKHGSTARQLYGYDLGRYGGSYDDALKVVSVWDVLETYAQLYFIYVMESSLLVSNYSIRTDLILQDLGNFPLWDSDFFSRDSRRLEAFSRHAHILDFDMLRIGRTVVENNVYRNAFEFGVVAVTEIGKERRNMFELKETKKKDDEVNQKNDGFNDCLKMARHRAVVDNFVFLKIIADEQRPSSLGADARELFDIIHIRSRSDDALAMPFFSLEDLIYQWLYERFKSAYSKYRFLRGDNTLAIYLLKNLTAALRRYYVRIYNRYAFNCLAVEIEDGTLEGGISSTNRYYLMWKKIYSMRFATDSTAGFFEERALRSSVGLNDVSAYEGVRATWEELSRQGSFMFAEWQKWNKTDDIDAHEACDKFRGDL